MMKREAPEEPEDQSIPPTSPKRVKLGADNEDFTESVISMEVQATSEPNAQALSEPSEGVDDADDDKKAPKKKVAMIYGYCGEGYQGLQRNPNAWTIEDELEKALFAAGCISKLNMGNLNKIGWVRAARTDKGVHAVGNVSSLKMLMAADAPDLIERMNAALPPAIRVFAVLRAQKNFNAKNHTDHRVYEYLLPTRACMPILRNSGFEFDDEAHRRLSDLFGLYIGTRNYHNFTQGMTYRDSQAKRFIKAIEVSKPFLVNDDPANPPLEVVRVTLTGQSFVLNQIRKMIAMVLVANRHSASPNVIINAFSEHKLNTPMAPGEFLTLDQTVYEAYNKRLKSMDSECSPIDMLEPTVLAAREKFKMDVVYPMMVRKERADNLTGRLLGLIDNFKPLVDGKQMNIYDWLKLYAEPPKTVAMSGTKTPKQSRREAYERRLADEQSAAAKPADQPASAAPDAPTPSDAASSDSATTSDSAVAPAEVPNGLDAATAPVASPANIASVPASAVSDVTSESASETASAPPAETSSSESTDAASGDSAASAVTGHASSAPAPEVPSIAGSSTS
eukprot:TRINITY_DN30720_c0_g1_i1.p1 TRINITY_DN30720_c0_g1~~TRINITY_DN30720_c0_g1_i1.p1  ORF type:complete len:564 (+),score=223.26 TRINITY_DN30720_c0_g1_i1:48-1739(+)